MLIGPFSLRVMYFYVQFIQTHETHLTRGRRRKRREGRVGMQAGPSLRRKMKPWK